MAPPGWYAGQEYAGTDVWLHAWWTCIIDGKEEPTMSVPHHLFRRQQEFSVVTFGPVSFRDHRGPLNHIQKEAAEAYQELDRDRRLEEYADIGILLMDALWRDGRTLEELAEAIHAKQDKNSARTWPDWRGSDPTKSLEHDRTGE